MSLSIRGLILVVLGIFIVLTPWYIFPVCEMFGIYAKTATGKLLVMPCGYTARAELGVGSMLALCGVVLFVAKSPETRRAIGGISTALGSLVILFPTVIIGMCSNPDHPCVTGTLPALVLLGVLTIALSLYTLLRR